MRHATILVAILALVPLASATAQLRPGTRVRVTHPPICPPYTICVGHSSGLRESVGTFLAWKADSLVMESMGDTLAVPQDFVTKLEVSTGRGYSKAQMRAGMIGGFFVGSAIGIAIAAVTAPREGCSGVGLKRTHGNCLFYGWTLGFLGGSLVGGVIGAGIPGDLWEEVSLDRLRVSFGPQRDGRFGLGASVRF